MPLIRARMYGDAICPKTLHIDGHFHHVRVVAATAVPKGGDLVDVHR
jgi:hypothetical protein